MMWEGGGQGLDGQLYPRGPGKCCSAVELKRSSHGGRSRDSVFRAEESEVHRHGKCRIN